MKDNIKIRRAGREDARFLSKTVLEAIGEELAIGLAGGKSRLPLVERLFTNLAADEVSQYSYRNSLVAENEEGEPVGAVIAYDGSRLRELRKAFIREANDILGWNVSEKDAEEWGDEAQPDEIYIDSLYVAPSFRRMGIASRLIEEVRSLYADSGKPLGLLVEEENSAARAAYERYGFEVRDVSRFFRVPMLHMIKVGI